MECVFRRMKTACIQAVDNIVVQVDAGWIIGKYDGLPVIVKGGSSGTILGLITVFAGGGFIGLCDRLISRRPGYVGWEKIRMS